MKRIYLSLLFMLIVCKLNSQNSILRMYAVDAIGNTDTLIFGLMDNASIGVDTLLGESNLFSHPLGDLDIRIRQRDSLNFSCGKIESLNQYVYWPENIDLKTDLRPYVGFDGFQNNTFEIYIHALHYPLNIRVDQSGVGFLRDEVLLLGVDKDCDSYFVDVIGEDQEYFLDETSVETPRIFYSFESFDPQYYIVNTENLNEIETNQVLVYPNPFNRFLNVMLANAFEVIVYSLAGKQLFKQQLKEQETKLDLSFLMPGMYYLNFYNTERGIVQTRKIIKH